MNIVNETTLSMVYKITFSVMLCIIVLYLGNVYGTRYGLAWGDEQLFVEIGETYSINNVLKAPSFEGNGSRLSDKIYLYPPVYPLSLGHWFKLVKPDLAKARLLSNIMGALSVALFFLLALKLLNRSYIAVAVSVLLAIDVQYAHLYNWARPDIQAVTMSLLSILLYCRCSLSEELISPLNLTVAWCIAVLGMLTHPVGGLIGFATIPAHLLITSPPIFKRFSTWIIFISIPLVGLLLWGIYIIQDIQTFNFQFFDWQSQRKAGRFNGMASYVSLMLTTLKNHGVFGNGFWAWSSSLFLLLAFVCSFFKARRREATIVVLVMLFSNFAVQFGAETAYPPLRMPGYYLSIGFVLWVLLENKPFDQVIKFRKVVPLLFASIILSLVGYKSISESSSLIHEIKDSERALSYDPSTLASRIIEAVPKGSSIGVRLFPACYDTLRESRHFSAIKPLAWAALDKKALEKYVLVNEYLAITESFLRARQNGTRVNVAKGWGADEYIVIAEKYYTLWKRINISGGGVTAIYKSKEDVFLLKNHATKIRE